MIFYISQFMQAFILPPGIFLIAILLSFIFVRSYTRFSKLLFSIAFISFWLLSTTLVANVLISPLQNKYPVITTKTLKDINKKNSAIVVLEAGVNVFTPEYDTPTVSSLTLTRLRYAAFLHQKTGIPVMVSGNNPANKTFDEAQCMANAMHDYFSIPVQWIEAKGFNTMQEGIFATDILKKEGIEKIYLVTHAFHMPRSVLAFQNRGMTIIPAATGYISDQPTLGRLSSVLPNLNALLTSMTALREYIGIAWYKLYYRV